MSLQTILTLFKCQKTVNFGSDSISFQPIDKHVFFFPTLLFCKKC